MRISRWVEREDLNYHPSVGAGGEGRKYPATVCGWSVLCRPMYEEGGILGNRRATATAVRETQGKADRNPKEARRYKFWPSWENGEYERTSYGAY